MAYTPPAIILEKYAKVLVDFALGEGKGIEQGDVVLIKANDNVKDFLPFLVRQILKSGGNPLIDMEITNLRDIYYEHASKKQLEYSPTALIQSTINQADHVIIMKSPNAPEPHFDPDKYKEFKAHIGEFVKYRREKYKKGKLTYTLGYYPSDYMAELAGCSLEAYWLEMIKACYLNVEDPVARWKQTFEEMHQTRDKLNELDIVSLHIKSDQTDLYVGLGEKRRWIAGSGRNIPSFEIYTSPDWRTISGIYTATEPVMMRGEIAKVIKLRFENGEVVESYAQVGNDALQDLLAETNAKRVGEFSLTDKRHSSITRYLAATIFDENRGGEYGNTHIALGNAYTQAYRGKNKKETVELGFNYSPVHVDIVSTEDRTVTATLRDGTTRVIYKDGMFVI